MTRDESIETLNTLYMAFAVFPNQQISLGNIDKMKESVSMALEALEQEPCDKCEVGNPCLYCKHEFEPQESEDKE